MKTSFFTYIKILAVAILLISFVSCSHKTAEGNEDTSNPSGNNNPTDENKGNHANSPQEAPGTQYPGSSANDSLSGKKDSLLTR